MALPDPGAPSPSGGNRSPRDARRERLIALLVLGVAVVLLVSSVTWFGTGRSGVGVGQLVLALALAGTGGLLYRRATRS